jgi:hypothetical protein
LTESRNPAEQPSQASQPIAKWPQPRPAALTFGLLPHRFVA